MQANYLIFRDASNITDALTEGEIDFETYTLLRDLYENKVDIRTDPLEPLLIIPGVTPQHISSLERLRGEKKFNINSLDKIQSSLRDRVGIFLYYGPESHRGRGRFCYKAYNQMDTSGQSDLEHNTNISWKHENWSALADLNSEPGKDISFLKRSVEFSSKSTGLKRAVAGNFRTSLGNGLIYGRSSRITNVSVNNDIGNELAHSVKYPNTSLSNGILLEMSFKNINPRAILDFDSSGTSDSGFIRSRSTGLELACRKSFVKFGSVLLLSNYNRDNGRRGELFSGSVFGSITRQKASAFFEYGMSSLAGRGLKCGAGFYGKEISSSADFWNFNDKLLSGHSGVLGQSDYEIIPLPDLELDKVIREPNIGERGIEFDISKSVNKLNLECRGVAWENFLDNQSHGLIEIDLARNFGLNLIGKSGVGVKQNVTQPGSDYQWYSNTTVDYRMGAWERICTGFLLKYKEIGDVLGGRILLRVETWRLPGAMLWTEIRYYDPEFAGDNNAALKISLGEKIQFSRTGFLNLSGSLYTGMYERPLIGKNALSRSIIFLKTVFNLS
ncbi:MAG: hypothetical protein ABIA63_13230 [bacterium]